MSEIIIVTGLPRSGTSLMMQILEKSEISLLYDDKRLKDNSNPEGYYELEAVKRIVADNSFLDEAIGKAIKIVSPLPMFINLKHKYKVIFMRREMDEILRSQEVMLNKDQMNERDKFKMIYDLHLKKTYRFLKENEIPFLDINYSELVNNPKDEIQNLILFCNINTSEEELISVVKPDLYRNRNEK